jgi:hypothetical protein
MVFLAAFAGNIRKPSSVRIGLIKGTSFSTNSTTRTLPSGCQEASKAVRGGNNSAEQIRPFLSATTFIMGLSHKQEGISRPFLGNRDSGGKSASSMAATFAHCFAQCMDYGSFSSLPFYQWPQQPMRSPLNARIMNAAGAAQPFSTRPAQANVTLDLSWLG